MQTVDALDLGHALERVITWLRESRDPQGLSASALSALGRLDTVGPLRITELAALEGLSQPGLTTLANRLEDAGLATRQPDPSDGRAVTLAITPTGLERVRAHREARAIHIATRIGQLSAEDQHSLEGALPALIHFTESPAERGNQ
ncbi:MAG: MarR family transcriptional regulator [Actinomycetota bacterium]